VQEQIDASVEDAVKLARSRLPHGASFTHCEACETAIPEARRKAIPGVRLCVACQSEIEKHQTTQLALIDVARCSSITTKISRPATQQNIAREK
jgi:phage/conjugal plasmid C-4 type zinc finger TraR family protein